MKLEFSRQFFEKYPPPISGKFIQSEPSCSMRTVGHDDANNRFSQFCERA